MSRDTTAAKRNARLRAKRKRRAAYTILFVIEILVGIAAGAVTAAILVPLAWKERGYLSFGSEWLFIIIVSYTAFWLFNEWIFKKLQEG